MLKPCFGGTIQEPSTNDLRFFCKSFTHQNLQDVGSKRVVIGSFHAIRHTLLLWIFRWHPPERDKANTVKIDSCRNFVVSGPKNQSLIMGRRYQFFDLTGCKLALGPCNYQRGHTFWYLSQKLLAMVTNENQNDPHPNNLKNIPEGVFFVLDEVSKMGTIGVDHLRWWQLKYVLFSPLGEMIHFDEHIGPGCQPRIGRLCSTLHRTPTEHAGGGGNCGIPPQKKHREKHGTAQAWKKWNSVFYRIHGTGIFTYITIKINHSCR